MNLKLWMDSTSDGNPCQRLFSNKTANIGDLEDALRTGPLVHRAGGPKSNVNNQSEEKKTSESSDLDRNGPNLYCRELRLR